MAVRNVENQLPRNWTAAELGQASAEQLGPSGERFVLVSYLTSPVPVKARLDYVVFALPPEASNLKVQVDRYAWMVTHKADPTHPVAEGIEKIGIFHWTPLLLGEHKITVQVYLGNTKLATLELTQQVQPLNATLEQLIQDTRTKKTPSTQADAQRELINELRGYIISAAQATGSDGIPARFLAAIIFMEIWGRPKEGTSNARAYRKRAAQKADPTWSEWTADEIREKLGMKREFGHIDDIRCVELMLVADALDDQWLDRRSFLGGKSIGVGQIALATAAMALGDTPWRDQPAKGDKQAVRDAITDEWISLGLSKQIRLYNFLRFPKTSIWVAAALLATLKNRPHLTPEWAVRKRWPDLTADQFWRNETAVGVIATEYNMGATDSDRTTAEVPKGNSNGVRAWRYVQKKSAIFPETFFP